MNKKDDLGQKLQKWSRIFLIFDNNLRSQARELQENFPEKQWCSMAISGEESSKSLRSAESIYSQMLQWEVDRSWLVLCLGGGCICDLGGFVASTYMRALPFAFIPSTLLAMVDASIGGKNGVNFGGFKNIIGCINLPEFVHTDVNLLRSLPKEQWSNGWAEMIKHGIIASSKHFEALEAHLPHKMEVSEKLIRDSQQIKLKIVASDLHDNNKRHLLNLGHSLGQAIEAHSLSTDKPISHGQAVSMGIALACRMAVAEGCLRPQDLCRIFRLLHGYGLPTTLPFPLPDALDALWHDKKRSGDNISFVLPLGIGKAKIFRYPINLLKQPLWWTRLTTAGVSIGKNWKKILPSWLETAPWLELRLDLMDREEDGLTDKNLEVLHKMIGPYMSKILLCYPYISQDMEIPNQRAAKILEICAGWRPAWVDIPFTAPQSFRKQVAKIASNNNIKKLSSTHYYEFLPPKEDLIKRVNEMFKEAEFVKIAAFISKPEQAITLMSLRDILPPSRAAAISLMVMGPYALEFRRKAEQDYMPFVFTAPVKGLETAPGQAMWNSVQDYYLPLAR